MQVFLILFGLAWGVSPFLLGWGLFRLWEKAKRLEAVAGRVPGLEANCQGLEERLKRMGEQVRVQVESMEALSTRLLKDNIKFVMAKVTANNFASSKKSLEGVFSFCEKNGRPVLESEQREIVNDLKQEFEKAVKVQWHREEQARIRRQIREEQRLEAERQRELQRLENQEVAAETALQKALQKAQDEHDVEVMRLRALLAEAQSKLEKAKSMAQLTRAGFVYVISNVGAFGGNVYKVGMTRRLEPLDRVRELGDASVPFPYDVHMMISTDDAPSLEAALHRELHKVRVNRVNPRREFFRVDIDTIARLVERNHGRVDYVADPEALEYNESLNMSEEDFDYVTERLAVFDEDEEGFAGGVAVSSGVKAGIKSEDTAVQTENVLRTPEPADDVAEVAQKKLTAKCPRCAGVLLVETLVDGENTCVHCGRGFRVKR